MTHLDNIGRWPVEGQKARKNKRMILIRPDDTLKVIHGKKNHTLVSFFVSNDFIHFGTMTIPVGKYSDPETHKGDEVIFVLDGTLIVHVYETGSEDSALKNVYKIQKNEKFLIPEKHKHRYLNLEKGVVRFLFGVAPEL
jgi:mannose-6-phosphate isomerase-like protein (cupin superfamily)